MPNPRSEQALVLAVSTLESSDEALDSGADAFLQKPFDPLAARIDGEGSFGNQRLPADQAAPIMTERLSSGAERLDAILGGGLPGNSMNLIMGLPGFREDDPRSAIPFS